MTEQVKTTPDYDKDSWQTPEYFFRWLEQRFAWFHWDGCATKANALCDRWIGPGSEYSEDFLAEDLAEKLGEHWQIEHFRLFVNPPYSNPLPFVKQAAALKQAGHFVVMLLPADTSTKWYQYALDHASEIINITSGRLAFVNPTSGKPVKGNNKGSMVIVFDPFMEDCVQRSVSLDFVKKCGGI